MFKSLILRRVPFDKPGVTGLVQTFLRAEKDSADSEGVLYKRQPIL